MRRHRRKKILVHILGIPTTFFFILPILWLLLLSFRPMSVIQNGLESVTSTQFSLENYITVFTRQNVLRYLLNSMIGAVVPAFVSVLVALLAGYSLIRWRFRGRTFFYSLPLFAQAVPAIQTTIPFYALMLTLGILNTYIAVILGHTSLVLPFAVWMMTGYLQGIPRELEEAAMIDGCSRLGAIFRVVIPIAIPGITATALVAFLMAWGEFIYGFVLTSSDDMRLLSVALWVFMPGAQVPTSWGLLFAMAIVFMIPSLLLFMLLQRFFVKGLSLGAVGGR